MAPAILENDIQNMNVPIINTLPRRRRRILVWTAGLLLVYTIFGFLVLPHVIRAIAVKRLSKELDRPVTIQKVRLNPDTISATVQGLLIKDRDGVPLAPWDEVYLNFELVSF